MRLSHILVGGVVAAAAVAGSSAFTAANSLEDNTVAGYDNTTVSGAIVGNIAYNPDTDPSKLASVVFTANGSLTGTVATMYLDLAGAPTASSTSDCTYSANALTPANTDITCLLDAPVLFKDFDGVALTVVSE